MTSENQRQTVARRAYVAAVIGLGTIVIFHSVAGGSTQSIDAGWVSLALLTLLSGSFVVRIPGATSTISVSETFVIIAAVRYGPGPAAILVALEGLIVSLWILKNTKEVYRVFFNMATGGLSVWVSAHLFFALAPSPLVLDSATSVATVILPLFSFATTYFLVNSWLIAFAIGLSSGRSAFSVWKSAFVLLSLNYISGASLAALLLPFIETVGLSSISLIAPLMVLAYVTFRAAMGRIADANTHLLELNKLYLSTIETLAMAIDAKDQITHGHVRRVQAYAIGLARAVGVDSEAEIKAIEAAALLHDMGKLAIPEHILNKPGKLTAAEFETMKQHANIGADILSAIDFPYPVVPIVRYHHEGWDGHGYPEGLSGNDIPIGARILAVVDCFDALTSDRPYRPRLSDAEALEILRERSGNMYDPSLVETFSRIYREIAPADAELDLQDPRPVIAEEETRLENAPSQQDTLDSISASTVENRMLYELAQVLSRKASVAGAAEVIAEHLRRCVPMSVFVLFVYDQDQDELVARYVSKDREESIQGMRIALGERISGWVAANRRTALNSDPALDLGHAARSHKPRLRSCLSTALETSDNLVGVITLYSTQHAAFSEQHRRAVEMVAAQTSEMLERQVRAGDGAAETNQEATMNLLNRERIERSFENARLRSAKTGLSLLVINVSGFDGGRTPMELAEAIGLSLEEPYELLQSGPEEFVVIMPQTNKTTREIVSQHLYETWTTREGRIQELRAAGATGPSDGNSLSDLIASARERLKQRSHWTEPGQETKPSVH